MPDTSTTTMNNQSMLKTPPKFNIERSLDRFVREVEIWKKVTTVPEESQGVVVTIHLPDDENTEI